MGFELNSKHIVLPYIIGIAWIICHPIISIVTGESKCRGIYIDEHQLDVGGFHTDDYPLDQIRRDVKEVRRIGGGTVDYSNVCNALDTLTSQYDRLQKEFKEKVKVARLKNGIKMDEDKDEEGEGEKEINPFLTPYISCHSQRQSQSTRSKEKSRKYSVVKIDPSLAPTTPVEALVLVVPYTSNWFESDLHLSIFTFMERMIKSPWLAKRILIVSPQSNSTSMETLVEQFLEDSASIALPMAYTNSILRQLVVLDMHASTEYKRDQFVVLTQGEKGIVPNLDLISGVRVSLYKVFGTQLPIVMHPFDLNWWEAMVKSHLPRGKFWQEWGTDFGHMIAFMAAFWR
jgi:hypothetical protein